MLHLLYLSFLGGGLDTNVRVLAPELVKAGHRVSVLYLHHPGAKIPAPTNSVDGYTVYHTTIGNWHYYAHRATLGHTSLPSIIRTLEYARALGKIIAEIHARQPLDLVELPEIFVMPRWMSGIPYAMRLHASAWTCRRLCADPSPFADSVEAYLEGVTLERAADISSPSRFIADYIRQACRVDKPIEIIPYPIAVTQFTPGTKQIAPPIILFVGRVERRKGADVLIRALPRVKAKYPNCEFVFAGTVCEDVRDQVAPATGQARFLGTCPREQLIAWYQRASIFVAPALWDNSPNTIYEAMACGTPVVASRAGGIPELVDDGVTGVLVPPRDETALVDAITQLLDDPSECARMGKRAREKSVEQYSVDKIMARTLDFYQRTLQPSTC